LLMASVAENSISTTKVAGNAFIVTVDDGEHVTESWLSKLWRWWNERLITARLTRYDEGERLTFIAQRFARVLLASFDERTKVELSGLLLCGQTRQLLSADPRTMAIRRKYGQRMAEWISIYTLYVEQQEKINRQKKLTLQAVAPLKLTVSRSLEFLRKIPQLERALQHDVDELLLTNMLGDKLLGCFRGRCDISCAILSRIQNLAATITQQIAWSMLIEPGRPRTDLSRFYAEFDVLESFFDKVELSTDELSTGQTYSLSSVQNDFLNASRVLGGPLFNVFILAQAPRKHTIVDFWKMIFLMQLMRGSVSVEHPMLTAGVFLRLQRRHAVANSMQWLFAYRTVLHWLQPFVISWYELFD
uniref:Tyrosine-protein phosphatase domain-containing protein n=1 Tax=Meloidogyne hapla TaxID=6305 RepID=A0A1I8BZI1_MELHA